MSPLLLQKLSGQHEVAISPERETGDFGMYQVRVYLAFFCFC